MLCGEGDTSTLLQGGDLFESGELEQSELDAGPSAAVAPDYFGQMAIERRRNEPTADALPAGCLQPARDRFRLLHPLQHLHGLLVEQLATVGEADRSAAALDQGNTEFVLELLDLPAERRLGDMQRLCRTSEVPLTRHGYEIAELSKFQTIPPRYGSDQFSLGRAGRGSAM